VLIWNERKTGSTFDQEYDQLVIKYGQNYIKLQHRNINTDHIGAFFDPEPFRLKILKKRVFDYKGLTGRLLKISLYIYP
jgi:hypothetical protein